MAEPDSVAAPAAPAGRIDAVDVARGVALAAMVAYHLTWDLGFLRLIPYDVARDPTGRLVAATIAGSFLFLVGVGLVLAHGDGIRWRPFLRRLAIVAGAALLITVATWFATPGAFIFFGILHMIALGSLLALPFLTAPPLVTLGAAAFFLSGPRLFAGAAFDSQWLLWLGLNTFVPPTNDYEPVFPWFGAVLIGVAFGTWARPALVRLGSRWQTGEGLGGLLAFAGRWSLPVYLLHQPVLLALLYPLSLAVGPHPALESAPFRQACQRTCLAAGTGPDLCQRTCECVVEELKTRGLWARSDLEDEQSKSLPRVSQQCFLRSARPPS